MSGGPPPPPPQYTEDPENPPEDWVPPPELAEEISNDPNIPAAIKQSISTAQNTGGGPPPPPAATQGGASDEEEVVGNDYDNYNNTETGVLEEDNNNNYENNYETGPPPPAANYDDMGARAYGGVGSISSGGGQGGVSSMGMLSTGNLLEDLDNMLRIYRVTFDDVQRSTIFIEFWKKWDELCTDHPKELLKIPTKVRGFLSVLPNITPYQADQIMKEVLSDGGLLAEPEFIERRYIFKIFLIYEFGNIFSWILTNFGTLKVWMFITSLVLSLAILTHVIVDFWIGNVWRALLMEFMIPLSMLQTSQFVDTPFFACVIRVIIEDNCSALATIPGRIFFNVLVVFFCLGSWEFQDVAILLSSFFVSIVTLIIFIQYSRLMSTSAHVRILTGSSQKLESKFLQYDSDRDGILNSKELAQFFQSFRQQLSKWQLEMMIMQYDIQRDNGLRFEALDIWFRKEPINADTRSQVLQAKPREFYGISDNANNMSNKELEWAGAGLAGMQQQSEAHNLALSAMGA